MPKLRTLFCLVDIKKRSFLTSCVFWFVFLIASNHLCFRFLVHKNAYPNFRDNNHEPLKMKETCLIIVTHSDKRETKSLGRSPDHWTSKTSARAHFINLLFFHTHCGASVLSYSYRSQLISTNKRLYKTHFKLQKPILSEAVYKSFWLHFLEMA